MDYRVIKVQRLSESAITTLPNDVERSGYDRKQLRNGVVHLGIGAFHRAHQAIVFDDAARKGDMRWGIVGASLRSASVCDSLVPQDCLYSVVEREGNAERVRIVGVLRDVMVAQYQAEVLVNVMSAADTHLVTLTVTEKGYHLDPVTGKLIESSADVVADLASLEKPRTAAGLIVAALAKRRASGLKPFTAISCDNLPHNGKRLMNAVLAIAQKHDPALHDWIATQGAFPETMVDRIVPATDENAIIALSHHIGVEDRAMIRTEPFLQWVIQNKFAGERPAFESLGVQLTDAVAPWEEAKLRMLNGAHSGIAYLGALAGINYVHEVVAIPSAYQFVELLWNESEATLSPPPGLDIKAYRVALMQRFSNAALQHRTRQIAMDGSQKLPQRLLAAIAVRLQRNLAVEMQSLAVAAWMQWQTGNDDAGNAHVVDDPLAHVTAAKLQGMHDAKSRVAALLSIEAIFPPALAANQVFRDTLVKWLDMLMTQGSRATLERAVAN
ncbi:MAG TPA: mannitol dehydrogenase family protein [Steroidobacteraceae bacterium]|nr:mannitol dehydrogenase family protein [Steroidobacteraceae bacterium]